MSRFGCVVCNEPVEPGRDTCSEDCELVQDAALCPECSHAVEPFSWHTGAAQGAAVAPGDPHAMQKLAGAEGALTSALSRLIAVSEAYPDLKANGSVAQLFEELASTENRVAFARQAYNDAVMEYNVARESFPASALAGTFGFTEAAPYEAATEAERAPVRVAL